MQSNLTILSTNVSDKGKYKVLEVSYKTPDGKVTGKNVMSFGASKDVFKTLQAAKQNEVWKVTAEKNDKGYWDWTAAERVGHAEATQASTPTAPKASGGNWETAEERFKKQVYIIRQSSLGTAVEMLNHVKKSYDIQEVLNTAKIFEEYVFGKSVVTTTTQGQTEDVTTVTEVDDGDIPL